MNRKRFTEKQIKSLTKNKYVLRVSKSSITYSTEFKELFIKDYLDGSLPRVIFDKYGFAIEVLGYKRIEQAAARWKRKYHADGILGLRDDRKNNSGRPAIKALSLEDKYKKLEAKNKMLEFENELLKKLDKLERGDFQISRRSLV